VFYIFLRGVDPARPGSGVYYRLPERGLIETLDKRLQPERNAAGGGA
jgi:hypothetical protein